jgi:hypothetical protein
MARLIWVTGASKWPMEKTCAPWNASLNREHGPGPSARTSGKQQRGTRNARPSPASRLPSPRSRVAAASRRAASAMVGSAACRRSATPRRRSRHARDLRLPGALGAAAGATAALQGATAALPWAASRRTRVAAAPAVRCKAGETPALRRPGGDRASSVSRFGWGCCNREAGVKVSWTGRGRQRARRPRSQGAVGPPRCSVLGARSSRAARHPVRNCVQDILAQYTPPRPPGRDQVPVRGVRWREDALPAGRGKGAAQPVGRAGGAQVVDDGVRRRGVGRPPGVDLIEALDPGDGRPATIRSRARLTRRRGKAPTT